MKTTKLTGYALAAAAAGMFATVVSNGAFAAGEKAADKATVKCENSTACKGHSACKTATSSCKGQNACKGTGVTMQNSEADCKKAQETAKK